MKFRNILAVAMMSMFATAAFATSDYSTWSFSKNIVINPAGLGLTAPVTNFPVLIRLSEGGAGNFTFSESQSTWTTTPTLPPTRQIGSGGGDLRFTDTSGTDATRNDLNYQIESWDGTGKTAEIWVLIPSVSNTTPTAIKMYWGKAGQTTPPASHGGTLVFKESNVAGTGCEPSAAITSATSCGFVTVHHLVTSIANTGSVSEPAATLGSAGTFNLQDKSSPSPPVPVVAGGNIIGSGSTFNGTSEGYGINSSKNDSATNFTRGNLTLSAWVNQTSGTTARIISKTGQYHLGINGAGQAEFEYDNNPKALTTAGACSPQVVTAALSAGWNYVVGVRKSDGTLAISVNGSALTFSTPTPGTAFILKASQSVSIGYESGDGGITGTTGTTGPAFFLNGSLDEPRIENVARSSDWIAMNYATQKATVTALTFVSAPPVVSYKQAAINGIKNVVIASDSIVSTGGSITGYALKSGSTLPTGVSLDPTTGVISGTSSVTFSSKVDTIIATGPGGTANAVVTVAVADTSPSISYKRASISGTKNTPILADTIVLTGTGVITNYAKSGGTTLPPGINLDPVTGVIFGTPTAGTPSAVDTIIATGPGGTGKALVTIAVTDVAPVISYKQVSITAKKGVIITPDTVVSTGGAVTGYALKSGNALPAGLNLDAPSGLIFGTPSAITASISDTIIATGPGGTGTVIVSIAVTDTNPAISYKRTSINGIKNVAILADTIIASGGAITSYAMASSTPLPAGLVLSPSTGMISGTPTAASISAVDTIIATGPGGTGSTVLAVAIQDTAPKFSYQQTTITGFKNVAITPDTVVSTGGAITSYAMSSSTPLPTGLILNSSTGLISGIPLVLSASIVDTIIATGPGGGGAATITLSVTPGQEDYTQWPNQKDFVINTSLTGANVPGNVTNFPMLVRLTSGNFADFATAGAKASLRFARGTTQLKTQVEYFDSTGGQAAAIWVKIDTVFGNNASQSFRMYWGKSGAPDSSKGAAVFDTANGYQAVYHLSKSDSAKDATLNSFGLAQNSTGTGSIFPIDTAGVIGRAESHLPHDFYTTSSGGILGAGGNLSPSYTLSGTGTNPKLELPDGADYTISAWANAHAATGTVGAGMLFCKSGRYYLADTLSGSNYVWELADYQTGVGKRKVDANLSMGAWHHIVGVHSGSTMTLYVDGVSSSNSVTESNPSYTHAGKSAGIARDNHTAPNASYDPVASNGMYFSGAIDEVEFSSVARDSNWIKLSYYTQSLGNAAPLISYSPGAVIDTLGKSASHSVISNGGNVTGYAVTSGILPAGLTLNTSTGLIAGIPTAAVVGNTITVTATGPGGTGNATLTLTVAQMPPVISYKRLTITATQGVPIVPDTVVSTGGGITSYAASPSLPAGLVLDSITGVISGQPTTNIAAASDTITATGPGGTGMTVIHFIVNVAPTIVSSPSGKTTVSGTAVKFNATVTGSTPLVFAWIHVHGALADTLRRDTLLVLTDTLALSSVAVTDTGLYKVVVRNIAGVIASDTARLLVNLLPSITSQPVNQNVTTNSVVKFGIKESGTAPFTFKWLRINKNASVDTLTGTGTTTDTLTLTAVALTADSTSYKCFVTNLAGSIVSNAALLRVSNVLGIFSPFVIHVTGSSAFTFRYPEGVSGVHMTIQDMQGHVVWTRDFAKSTHATFSWNGVGVTGHPVSSGMYVVRMKLLDADQKAVGDIKRTIDLTR